MRADVQQELPIHEIHIINMFTSEASDFFCLNFTFNFSLLFDLSQSAPQKLLVNHSGMISEVVDGLISCMIIKYRKHNFIQPILKCSKHPLFTQHSVLILTEYGWSIVIAEVMNWPLDKPSKLNLKAHKWPQPLPDGPTSPKNPISLVWRDDHTHDWIPQGPSTTYTSRLLLNHGVDHSILYRWQQMCEMTVVE